MKDMFILLLMIFNHIIADYNLQGILAKMKQKEFWNEFDKVYKNDYIAALICHSFCWSFMIMLPIAYVLNFKINLMFLAVLILNIILHYVIDNLKANQHKITLNTDQFLHFLQILITWLLF